MTDEIRVEAPEVEEGQFNPAIMGLTVTNKKTQQREFQMWRAYGIPTLDMVNPEFPAPDYWIKEVIEVKGAEEKPEFAAPRYDDQQLQYLQDALTTTVQNLERNRAKNPDNEPCMTFADIFAAKDAGSYQAKVKEFKEALGTWLFAQDMSDAKKKGISNAFRDQRKLSGKAYEIRQKYKAILDQFIADTETGNYKSVVSSLANTLDKPDEDDGFLDD